MRTVRGGGHAAENASRERSQLGSVNTYNLESYTAAGVPSRVP